MDIPFIYDRYVTNKDFAGRKSECLALTGEYAPFVVRFPRKSNSEETRCPNP